MEIADNTKSSTPPFCTLVIQRRQSPDLRADLLPLFFIIQKLMLLEDSMGNVYYTLSCPNISFLYIPNNQKHFSQKYCLYMFFVYMQFLPHCNKHRETIYGLTSISKARDMQERRCDQRQSAKHSMNMSPTIYSKQYSEKITDLITIFYNMQQTEFLPLFKSILQSVMNNGFLSTDMRKHRTIKKKNTTEIKLCLQYL